MNQLKVFENPEFGKIRTVEVKGQPWFVGKDVAAALGYAKAQNAISAHVDHEDRKVAPIQGTPGGTQEMTVINESGLYSLIMSSKLPQAKEFKRWVTSEVLPAIRKNGGYIAGQNEMTDAELMAKAVLVAHKAIDERDRRIARLTEQAEEMRPKALFADAVAASGNSILIGELAKMLRQNGVDMGEKRLFGWMRENGYLIRRKGTDYNMPTQRSMEMGLFQIKETVVNHASGYTTVNKTPKVTGKGQTYFINKFLGKEQ